MADIGEITFGVKLIRCNECDRVKVVRCKDCKHYIEQMPGENECCTINAEYDEDVGVWYGLTSYPPPEFFCADGERKEI